MNCNPTMAAALAANLLLAPVAFAFTLDLSAADIEEARTSGQTQAANTNHGYKVNDYVLYDVPDPLRIAAGQGEVDAVVVGTPFERLRYQSYLTSMQGIDMTAQDATKTAQDLGGTLHVVVFAHSAGTSREEKDFLQQFSGTKLTLTDGRMIMPEANDIFGPARDFYMAEKASGFYWLGYRSYRFRLASLAGEGVDVAQLKGTVSFADSTGRAYSFPIDLGKYR
jgi:hypothetical protein